MRILFVAALLAFAGCAAQPEASTAPAPAALAVPAGEQAMPSATSAAQPADKPRAFEPPPGYKRRLHAGQTVYCKKMVVLGSRFPKQDCRTQAELEELLARGESMRGDLDQQQHICSGAKGCASR